MWLLTTPLYLRYVATLPCNLSLMACFAVINVPQGSVATYARCGVIFSIHTHPFNGPFSRTTRVSRYQEGKTNLDFTEAKDSEWQRHQLGHMQVCMSIQTDNHASTPPLSFLQAFLPPNQQCQSTERNIFSIHLTTNLLRNLPLKVCWHRFWIEIVMLMGMWSHFFDPPCMWRQKSTGIDIGQNNTSLSAYV